MPKSHWNSHADLLNGTDFFFFFFFFGTGLVQPGKETNEKSMKYIIFFGLVPAVSNGPLFDLKRQIFDIFHWPNLCMSHVSATENLRSPRTCWTIQRMYGPAFLDLGMTIHRTTYDCTAGPKRSTRGLGQKAV